jgi:hypothetical protein
LQHCLGVAHLLDSSRTAFSNTAIMSLLRLRAKQITDLGEQSNHCFEVHERCKINIELVLRKLRLVTAE